MSNVGRSEKSTKKKKKTPDMLEEKRQDTSFSDQSLGAKLFDKSESNFFQEKIVIQGVKTHNLKNIDVEIPKNKLITITGVSGSGKSSLAFHTIYKEGQFRYIESLSSYLRQFFNLGTRPDIEASFGLSPAIAIEQNKSIANNRSTMGTLTEIDDYLRLLFAKTGRPYSYVTGAPMRTQSVDMIIDDLYRHYQGKKIFLLKESKKILDPKELDLFVKSNRKKVEEGKGFTRYLIMSEIKESIQGEVFANEMRANKKQGTLENSSSFSYLPPIEFFYLETPRIPDHYFPIKLFGIYDRITLDQAKKARLKEDIIKILAQEKKFGVWSEECSGGNENECNGSSDGDSFPKEFLLIRRYTDKNYCPVSNIEYPDFTPQHFSFNRAEGACPHCHGIGEVLQVDLDKVIDPQSPYMRAVLPWRDSRFGQAILFHLAQKYGMDQSKRWCDLPTRFCQTVIEGDNELMRINTGGKFVSIRYKGIEDVLKDQYNQGVLTVDFQAMLEMKKCPVCNGAKLRKESLHVFLCIPKKDVLSFSSEFENVFGFSPSRNDFSCQRKNQEKTQNTTLTSKKGKAESSAGEKKSLFPVCFHEPIVDEYDDEMVKVNIAEMQAMTIRQIRFLLELYQKTADKNRILVDRIIRPLLDRVQTIEDLGLGYLSLNRPIGTLSGGELQRLRLAKQLGNKLTGIIYVLDEPTIGLSPEEITKVIKAIKRLRDMGNTIIVVEHNEEFILASDWIIEIGPGAGDFGGEVVFSGSLDDFLKADTITSCYVTHRKKVSITFDHRPQNKWITIKKAHKYNLKHIDVSIQLGSFTIITGHSGAGKTTLMYETLFKFLSEKEKYVQSYIRLQLLKQGYSWQEIMNMPVVQKDQYENWKNQALQLFYEKEIAVETIRGYEEVDQVLYVDQTSIGKTPRSCPATFIGVFDAIRLLYAGTNEAKYLGFTAGHFSFNSSKGACPECEGHGYKKVELQFLPDTYVPCELCNGRRYKSEILDITWRGKNITQVLDMYIKDALVFFADMPHIARDLQLMVDIGLGYLRMGQPAHTLSGGESQRLKLVKHLLKEYKGHTLYFLDEPTVGLHPDDINRLLKVFKQFLDRGDTILMIEHDPDLLRFADHVIELRDGEVLRDY